MLNMFFDAVMLPDFPFIHITSYILGSVFQFSASRAKEMLDNVQQQLKVKRAELETVGSKLEQLSQEQNTDSAAKNE